MNLSHKVSSFLALVGLFATNAEGAPFAMGPGASGGGKAVVCRDPQKKITHAELLDIYEGRILYGRVFSPPSGDFREILKSVEAKIRMLQAPVNGLGTSAAELFDRATLLPAGTRLEPTDDAMEVIIPDGCQLEQLAAYNTRLDRLFIDSEIWGSLDELNRAALLLHENLYDLLRVDADEQDSFYARQVVGYLISNSELVPLFKPVDGTFPAKVYDCFVYDRAGEPAQAHFYLYNRLNGDIVIQREIANRRMLFAQTTDILPKNVIFPGGLNTPPATLDELVGQKSLPYPVHSLGDSYNFSIKNASATMGWTEKFALNLIQDGAGSRLQITVGYYRPGSTGFGTALNVASCSILKR